MTIDLVAHDSGAISQYHNPVLIKTSSTNNPYHARLNIRTLVEVVLIPGGGRRGCCCC
jgi:hypothetical protein